MKPFNLITAACLLGLTLSSSGAAQVHSEPAVQKPEPAVQKIGIVFTKLASWGEGRWRVSYGEASAIEKQILETLKKKASGKDLKSEVVKFKDIEEAKAQGVSPVYLVEYREERADYKDMPLGPVHLEGTCTNIISSFRRGDSANLTTNWDSLTITSLCKDLNPKVEEKAEPGTLRMTFRPAGVYAEEMLRNSVFTLSFKSQVPQLLLKKPGAGV